MSLLLAAQLQNRHL